MRNFPSAMTGLVKKGPSGENAFFADDAAAASNSVKNVASTATQGIGTEDQSEAGVLKSNGESLQYPMQTAKPAYQARVTFTMFSLKPKQDGVDNKGFEKKVNDNLAQNNANLFGVEDANSSVGPHTISALSGDDDETTEVRERLFSNFDAGSVTTNPAGRNSFSAKLPNFSDLKDATLGKILNNNIARSAIATITGGTEYKRVPEADIVDMYFPLTLQYADTARYDNAELGFLGTSASAALQSGAGALSSVLGSIGDGTTNVFDVLKGNSTLGEGALRLGAARLANAVGGIGLTGIRNALTLQNRVVVNPNIRAIFGGVALREFTFNFKMIAESQQEALTIQKIIKHFRREMYPAVYSANLNTGVSADLGYKFPNVFQINFKHKGSTNTKLPKIKYCYLRSVSHTINPTGGTFRRDGQPNEIDLNLSFVEFKTLTQEDIDEGF